MKAILWKEIRENAKWSLLILAVLAVAQFFALGSGRSGGGSFMADVTVLSSMFLMVTSFGSALAGVALGFLQILPEQARDQWASLLHRPAGRGIIFGGKAIAGSLLVLLATGIPLLLSAAYIQIPGQFASPFFPQMLEPGLSDLLLGQAFYFGGLAAGLHRGRWWGARGLFALSLLAVFVLHVSGQWPIWITALAAALYGCSAWGMMAGGTKLRDRPRIARYAAVGMILLGSLTAVTLLGSLVFLLPFWPKPPQIPFRHFAIARDGTILVTEYSANDSAKITDLDGNPVTDPRYRSNSGNEFLNPSYLTWSFELSDDLLRQAMAMYHRTPARLLGRVMLDYGSPELWFYLVGQRSFVGYDKLSRRPVGTMGRGGFAPPGQAPTPFSKPLKDSTHPFGQPHLYAEGLQIFEFDFGNREMRPFFLSEGSEIVGFGPLRSSTDEPLAVAVALRNALHILAPGGERLAEIAYMHDPMIWGQISVVMNPDLNRFYVISRPAWDWSRNRSSQLILHPSFLDEYSMEGKLLASYELAPPALPQHRLDVRGLLAEVAMPFAPLAVSATVEKLQGASAARLPGNSGLFGGSRITSRALMLSLTASVVAAILAGLWGRRVGMTGAGLVQWSVFAFCFGLPGLLAFRFAATWPTRVPCSACAKRRDIEADECSHCHAPWPVPSATGQEIFIATVNGTADRKSAAASELNTP